MFKIVCYLGGTCGDLVTGLLDPTDAKVDHEVVVLSENRTRLKKPHLFSNDQERDQYLLEIATQYKSVPSHDFEYHRRKGHDVLLITVQDPQVALWAAKRFKELHRKHVWEEMMRTCNAANIEQYATVMLDWSKMAKQLFENTLSLESILDGTALQNLSIDHEQTVKLYQTWLDKQT